MEEMIKESINALNYLIDTLTTGNVAHHRASMKFILANLKKLILKE